ncbi:MAG: glutaredoxin family protein [Gemmataceae bacterium]|nr:glutaredoxin family protein [Gemmataceae bacterium]
MVLGWLRAWWGRGRRGALAHLSVVLYTRQGCHLCEEAWALLQAQSQRHGFGLEAVDVDSDADLAARYGLEVPVVLVGEKVRFRGVVNRHLLERLFLAESGRAR